MDLGNPDIGLASTFVCICTEKFMSCILHSYLKALVIILTVAFL